MGRAGFIAFLLLGGMFAAVGWFGMLGPELEVNRRFVPGRCTVVAKEVVEGNSTRRKSGRRRTVYRPEFHVRLDVDGRRYEARTFRITAWSTSDASDASATLARYEVGQSYPCWYDPDDPNRVVLERGTAAASWIFTGGGAVIGLVGLVGLGKRWAN